MADLMPFSTGLREVSYFDQKQFSMSLNVCKTVVGLV